MSIPVTGPASGFRDMYGDELALRNYLLKTITQVYRSFGYEQLETPVVEKRSTLMGKGGGENEKLMYKVLSATDEVPANAELGLRFDLTIPLARFVAQHAGHIRQLLPFRRFAVGEVFRGERPQHGRYRSFMQCDADIIGAPVPVADAEMIELIQAVFFALQIPITIHINNRKIIDGLVEVCNIPAEEKKSFITILDNYYKVGKQNTQEKIIHSWGREVWNIIDTCLSLEGNPLSVMEKLRDTFKSSHVGWEGCKELMNTLACTSSVKKTIIDPTIARGLDYYTGNIYETFIDGHESLGSVCSGGRYDQLLAQLGSIDMPAIGVSVGVDRLLTVLAQFTKDVDHEQELYYVTVMDTMYAEYSHAIAKELRGKGHRVIVATDIKSLSKQLADASKRGAVYTIIIGSDEKAAGNYLMKNMHTGEQTAHILPKPEIM